MLHKPDKHQQRLLDLADFIDDLDPDRFSMGTWGCEQEPRCICGWYQHLHGHIAKDDWGNAADGLGLDRETANKLFTEPRSKKQAVQRLRELALA